MSYQRKELGGEMPPMPRCGIDRLSVTMVTDIDGRHSRAVTVSIPLISTDAEKAELVLKAFDWLYEMWRKSQPQEVLPHQRQSEPELEW